MTAMLACFFMLALFIPIAVLPPVLEALYSVEELAQMGVQTTYPHNQTQ